MDRDTLVRIARKQRQFVLLFATIYLVNIVVNTLVIPLAEGMDPETASLGVALGFLGLFLALVAMLVFLFVVLFQLMAALDYGIGMFVLFFVVMWLPCVNLIVLLVVNSKATEELRRAGVHVGFIGASSAQIEELKRGPSHFR